MKRMMMILGGMATLALSAVACGQAPADGSSQRVENKSSGKGWNEMTYHKPMDEELRKELTPLQYQVTQEEATETAFHNTYWDNHADGIYVDVVSGEPLFSSLDKYDSGTGWPSFTRPLEPGNIAKHSDGKLVYERTEVRSAHADSHLGHVFDDGPAPTGMRFCMNSAALRFIPVDRLEAEGYGQYLALFQKAGKAPKNMPSTDTAVFAGGCFWGMEAVFEHLKGVQAVTTGYTGGRVASPSYQKVSSGKTGHAEGIEIAFDPTQITYRQLLEVFFKVAHDPTERDRQGPDFGSQYRSAVFYRNAAQRETVEAYLRDLNGSKVFSKPIATQIVPLTAFYKAEDYHQDYIAQHPNDAYCVINDLPKLENLKKDFPELYREPKPN